LPSVSLYEHIDRSIYTAKPRNCAEFSMWIGDLADLREGDRYLVVNRFFHTFGYKAGCIASLIRGATIVPAPAFDVERIVNLIERERITMLPGPPTLYHSLLSAEHKRSCRCCGPA
jgi:acyl-CoA synthetase (AMP-forming)/AMP-acid ligase II